MWGRGERQVTCEADGMENIKEKLEAIWLCHAPTQRDETCFTLSGGTIYTLNVSLQ